MLALILFPLMGTVSSCSEDSEDTDEYANWQERNDKATDQWAASSGYLKIVTFSKLSSAAANNSDYIYVQVLETGSGTDSPLYADTARVAYRGWLIPTETYSDGYVFDQSYLGDFSWATAGMVDFSINSNLRDGFSTALLNMHKGDRWRVSMPYQLGYGSSSSGSVPAYSNLIFDIALLDFWHPGEQRPPFAARKK